MARRSSCDVVTPLPALVRKEKRGRLLSERGNGDCESWPLLLLRPRGVFCSPGLPLVECFAVLQLASRQPDVSLWSLAFPSHKVLAAFSSAPFVHDFLHKELLRSIYRDGVWWMKGVCWEERIVVLSERLDFGSVK